MPIREAIFERGGDSVSVREGARHDRADRTAQDVLGYDAQGVGDGPQSRMDDILGHGNGRRGVGDRADRGEHENGILNRSRPGKNGTR